MTNALAPTAGIAEWLLAALSGDAELGALAPGGLFGRGATVQTISRTAPSWPAVVFGVRPGGKETYNLDGSFSFAQVRYQIEAIDKSRAVAGAYAAAARIHRLISTPSQTDTSGLIMRCVRLSVVDRAETADGGTQFQHAGGIYEIWVKS